MRNNNLNRTSRAMANRIAKRAKVKKMFEKALISFAGFTLAGNFFDVLSFFGINNVEDLAKVFGEVVKFFTK